MCRYCGHRFVAATLRRPRQEKSPAGAALLSFIVPGLGHFYIGEGWRGGVFLITILISIGAAVATSTAGPGLIIGIIGLVDAYRGAKEYNATGHLRGVGPGIWVMLAIIVVLATVAIVNAERLSRSA